MQDIIYFKKLWNEQYVKNLMLFNPLRKNMHGFKNAWKIHKGLESVYEK